MLRKRILIDSCLELDDDVLNEVNERFYSNREMLDLH